MNSFQNLLRLAIVVALGALVADTAAAGPAPTGAACDIGKVNGAIRLDVNGSGEFEGNAGGDAFFELAAFDPAPERFFRGDFNGDGVDEVGRHVDSTAIYVDLNGSFSWDGEAGGDQVSFFAPGQGFAPIVVGDWDMDGDADLGKYVPDTDLFSLDVNDNGTFDGNAGGDAFFALAAFVGPGTPFSGDFDGDGVYETGKVVGPNNFIIDLNGNRTWDGNAGGDLSGFFAPGQSDNAVVLVGDWNGDGSDEIGIYNRDTDTFALDVNGSFEFEGNAGGDAFFALAAFVGVGDPAICDWDGDGSDEPAKVVDPSNWILDANGNLGFDGAAGGDINTFFGPGSDTGTPFPGVWSASQ